MNQKDLNDKQQQWVNRPERYDFDIVYVKEKKNVLSIKPHLCSLVEIIADWRELISAEYAKDSWVARIMEGTIHDDKYTMINELIIY